MQNALERLRRKEQNQLEQLKLLFDYTKFHIGLYTTLATIVAGILAIKSANSTPLFAFNEMTMTLAILFICIAGFAGGVIASSIPGYDSYDRFWRARIGPRRCEWMMAEDWAYLEHAAFWLAVILAISSVVLPRLSLVSYVCAKITCLP